MIFGFIDDAIKTTQTFIEDVFDISVAVISFGEYGELSRENVTRLIATGVTLYALSEASGIAVDTLQEWLDNE